MNPDTKKSLSEAQIAANRTNLQRAMEARKTQPYVLTAARLAANRVNIAKGRAVYRNTIYSMPDRERAEYIQKHLEAAQAELERNGQRLWHGMTCASLLESLKPAGERLEDLQSHFRRFKDALGPRDREERRVVQGMAELMWRRLRGVRLGGRWEARKLAAVLGKRRGGAPPGPAEGDDPETAAERLAVRGEYAEELAFDILQVLERASGLIENLEAIQRRLMILVRSFGRRCGEPLLPVIGCGEKREQQVTAQAEDTIGNPFARPAGEGKPSTGGNDPDARVKPAFTQADQRHYDKSNVKGLGKADSVATPEQFRAAFVAAMGTMNDAALLALKDLAEAVCARLQWLEEEARQEAAELGELLAAVPRKDKVEDAGLKAGAQERQDARLKAGATSADTSADISADANMNTSMNTRTDADGDIGATERKEQSGISREARNDRVDGAGHGGQGENSGTGSADGPQRRGFAPPLQGQDSHGAGSVHSPEMKGQRQPAGDHGGEQNRWRGFLEAQEILKSRLRGSRNSKAFGVCLSLGLIDIVLHGDNRLMRVKLALERDVMTCMDRWVTCL